ncbi:hypothetical protein [Maricaulis maris]|jgi:hypothetical protein|uniref:Uncharacterized protein n=1 Tax=Maricaulis maris (strain MCS10) TaxID=394221 RepID=Q0AQS3_MARMM|nr:hypothetical protein [Maricaulis maris]ABI65364.1 hypothetical protein Mmar10_1071 [Maricaulis maris MCS10]
MSGYVGAGRLQDGEWLMRACMLLNKDLPLGAEPYTEMSQLNRIWATQSAEVDRLLALIDPEGDIDQSIFPVLAFFDPSEGWPLDIILAAMAALGVWLFLPDWYGVAEYLAYLLIAAFVAIQYLRARRLRERARTEMIKLGLDPDARHPLTLRILVRYRKKPVTLH